MSDDLVKRLREWDHCWPARWLEGAVAEAADRIEHLESEMAFAMMTGHDLAKSEYRDLLNEQEARIEALERERDEAYAKGYGDCEEEISMTEIGQQNERLHNERAKFRAALAAMTQERDEAIDSARHIALHGDMVTDDLHDTQVRLAECEARLSKAVEALREIAGMYSEKIWAGSIARALLDQFK